MDRLPKHRIGLTGPKTRQIPLAEYRDEIGYWVIWLNYNMEVNAGTYLELRPDGECYKVTVQPSGEVSGYEKQT